MDALLEHKPWDYEIVLQERKEAPFRPIYQLSEKEQTVLKEFIEEFLRKGWIRESTLLVGSLVLFAPKLDKKLRLCVDYRKLNVVTIKDQYTLLLVDKIRNKVREARWFTKIDIR